APLRREGQRSNPNSGGALGGVDTEAGARGAGGAGAGAGAGDEAVAGGAGGGWETGEGGGAGAAGCGGDWLGAREATRRWTGRPGRRRACLPVAPWARGSLRRWRRRLTRAAGG